VGVIAVYSPKGGVGKTTVAVDLAWRMAAAGRSTLLWDLDVQGGAGFLLGAEPAQRERAASVFQREGDPARLIAPTVHAGLHLLQSDPSLRQLPLQLARLGKRGRLRNIARDLSVRYARIVLDCPPADNELADQILRAADLVIVPLPPSPLGARALDLLKGQLARDGGRHPPVLPLVTMYDVRRKAHREAIEGAMAGLPVIPQASPIEQMAFRRAPVGSFAPSSDASQALAQVWRAVERKLEDLALRR
jgi:cellulose biosynthesis protein BcsQ